MRKLIAEKLRPSPEDFLRMLGYFALGAWAVLFAVFPATVFCRTLDLAVLYVWMSFTLLGALIASLGSLTRIDLKMEFPGLLVVVSGPIFYSICQIYFAVFPDSAGDDIDRTALIVYASIPAILLLPRIYSLRSESKRLQRINTARLSGK